MSEKGKKRGQHPRDKDSFHPDQMEKLLSAVRDLAWLKSRGYADPSSLKLVGDRYSLNARQRTAVARCTCSDPERDWRLEREVNTGDVVGKNVYLDGFNLLTTVEAAMGNGVLLIGRDGCVRDMSSMHGNYRVLSDTDEGIDLIHELFSRLRVKSLRWLLDKPVSNSGRLKAKILDRAQRFPDLECEVELVQDPDELLRGQNDEFAVVVTADSGILNDCGPWFNAASEIVKNLNPQPGLIVNLSGTPADPPSSG